MVRMERSTLHFNDPIGGFVQESLQLEVAMKEMISSAKEHLHLVSYSLPAFSPKWYLHGVVDNAVQRGVKLRIHAHKRSEVRSLMSRLRDFDVRGWYFQPPINPFPLEENSPESDEGDGLFHIKAIMVDGVRIYLGSANLSVNAVTNSAEWGLISESPDMCRQLEGYLHHLESKGQFREV